MATHDKGMGVSRALDETGGGINGYFLRSGREGGQDGRGERKRDGDGPHCSTLNKKVLVPSVHRLAPTLAEPDTATGYSPSGTEPSTAFTTRRAILSSSANSVFSKISPFGNPSTANASGEVKSLSL